MNNDDIFFVLLVCFFMAVLAFIFGKSIKSAKRDGKKVKFITAVVCCAIMILAILYIIYCCLFALSDLYGAIGLCSLLAIPMSWIGMCFVRGCLPRIGLFLVYPAIILFFLVAGLLDMGTPLDKSDVRYTTHEEVKRLLDVDSFPKLKYEWARQNSEGTTVELSLENPADSIKLNNIYKHLRETRSIHFYYSDVYQVVDNIDSIFTNISFSNNNGITINYGHLWFMNNNHYFDSIQAPLPIYDFVTYERKSCGPADYAHYQRIQFKEPLPVSWLNKVKKAAQKNEAWDYSEEDDQINIHFSNSRDYLDTILR